MWQPVGRVEPRNATPADVLRFEAQRNLPAQWRPTVERVARSGDRATTSGYSLSPSCTSLLVVEAAVVEAEGPAGTGKRNLFIAAPANDLLPIVLSVVDDLIDTAILAEACEHLECGFMVKGGKFADW